MTEKSNGHRVTNGNGAKRDPGTRFFNLFIGGGLEETGLRQREDEEIQASQEHVCIRFVDSDPDHLEELPDEEVVGLLTSVQGIGLWAAQMFLMFNLGRLNVFAPDDVGLRNAMVNLYDLVEPSKKELTAFAERWNPFKTIACWYLWHSLDNMPK